MNQKEFSRLVRNYDLLKAIYKAGNPRREALISVADDDLIEAICACCRNIIGGVVPLTDLRKRRLIKYRKTVKDLSDSVIPIEEKKEVIQTGGFITTILPAILAPIIEVIASKL